MKLPDLASEDDAIKNTYKPRRIAQDTQVTSQDSVLSNNESTFFSYDPNGPKFDEPKKKRGGKIALIIAIVLLVLLAAAYIGGAIFFKDHFVFNTTVNGAQVAFATAEDVQTDIDEIVASYALSIEARDQNATITATDISLESLDDSKISSILEKQNEWLWPLSLIPGNEATIEHLSVGYDKQKLEEKLAALPMMNPEEMVAPTDAALAFENGAYVITPGEAGNTLDLERTTALIQKTIDEGQSSLNLEEEGLYLEPEIGADDPQLIADRDKFNQYVPFQITYTLGDRTEVLNGYTTINWVVEAEVPYLDEGAIRAWVAEFASRYDTLGATRTFNNGFGEEKTVTGGTYGWNVDQESEYWSIVTAYQNHTGETREPYFYGRAASLGAQDWGTTYLEVDTSHQYMWYFVDGVCVLETDIVSGNPNTGYATPEGVWYIYSKTYGTTLRGPKQPDGSYEWESWVDYWMPFSPDGCGFHDASWQPTFGGTWYLTNGSHGCINMPPYLAGNLIEMLEPGTPVLIHY